MLHPIEEGNVAGQLMWKKVKWQDNWCEGR